MRKRAGAEEREQFLHELTRSGEPVRVVAERIGLGLSTAYRWSKLAKMSETSAKPTFARLVPARSATVTVQVGLAQIRVEAGFDAELLRAVVLSLSKVSS